MTKPSEQHGDIKVPGYTLEKLIGSGGYGEVWLAHAPGGLTKAVKLIFGFYNEKRASSELHSLEKIKSVRHPFLLSLERIEIVEGRLVIVTELADGSLKDRFDQSVQNGQQGIDREELLGYLRDSADALDYLSTQHSLQHLDIKPENLLLLAGHVKVADFGLVKEIQETQASLVGGLTPLYSSPEVFQGRPTIYSDQYSLAVLYQEMLTGKLPFDGSNSAELTLQHMHDEPDLTPLPLADRYVIARALAKDPQQRYGSCKELVQALLKADDKSDSDNSTWTTRPAESFNVSSAPKKELPMNQPGSMTQVFDDDLISDSCEISDSMLIDLPSGIEKPEIQLPTLDLQSGGFQPTPTIIIGVGGTAGSVLAQLRNQLIDRFGEGNTVPSMQLLLLDTDKKSLLKATHGNGQSVLSNEETLALPLRRPQEYRDRSDRLLGWLSRRWLYNIPKSLKTEGLRPLGRLAFTDHARLAIQRIRIALSQAMDDSAVKASMEQTGLTFKKKAVRVYIVASASGGTGSGMSLDLGYAVKGLLEKLGIEDANTTGIIMHSTGRDSRYCDLSKVNTFSWLKEYNHFARPEGFYPGDEASGLPAMTSGTGAFDNTYFLPLGEGLTTDQLQHRTANVANYIYLDSFTEAHTFFEASRKALPEVVSGNPALRTFGLYEKSSAAPQLINAVAQQISQKVVLGWSGNEHDSALQTKSQNGNAANEQDTASLSDTNQIICGAPRAVAHLQLNFEGISANARTLLEGQFGTNVESLLSDLLIKSNLNCHAESSNDVLKVVDTLFAPAPDTDGTNGKYILGRRLDAIVSPLGMKLASDLQRWLLHRFDEEQERLAGTRLAAEWFSKHFERVEVDAQRLAKTISHRLVAIVHDPNEGKVTDTNSANNTDLETNLDLAIKYFRLRLDLCAIQATVHLVRMLLSELKTVGEAIVEFGRHLRHLGDTLSHDLDSPSDQMDRNREWVTQDPLGQKLLQKTGEITAQVDQQLQNQFIQQQGGLFETVMGSRKVVSELLNVLRSISEKQVALAAKDICQSGEGAIDSTELHKIATQANTELIEIGGATSQLVILPQQEIDLDTTSKIRNTLGSKTSIMAGIEGNLSICNEAGLLPIDRVAVELIECRRDYAEFADRVHTRNDIVFTPLTDAHSSKPEALSQFATQII